MQAPPSYYDSLPPSAQLGGGSGGASSSSSAAAAPGAHAMTPAVTTSTDDLDTFLIDSPFIKQEDVDLMMSMGFKKSFCQVALVRNSGNVNDAISMVLENNDSAMTSFVREYRNNQRFMAGAGAGAGAGASNDRLQNGGKKSAGVNMTQQLQQPHVKKGWSFFNIFNSDKDKKAGSSLNVIPALAQARAQVYMYMLCYMRYNISYHHHHHTNIILIYYNIL